MEAFTLTLFIAGDSPRSMRARENLARAMNEQDIGHAPVREVNLLEEPGLAMQHRIIATPSLALMRGGEVVSTLYGDLSDGARTADFLLPLKHGATIEP